MTICQKHKLSVHQCLFDISPRNVLVQWVLTLVKMSVINVNDAAEASLN